MTIFTRFRACHFAKTIVLCGVLFLSVNLSVSRAESGGDLAAMLRAERSWHSPKLDRDVAVQVYFAEASTGGDPAPVVVYVKNHAHGRIGTDSDQQILVGILAQGFIVVTADFGNDPKAFSPYFDEDLRMLFRSIYGRENPQVLSGLNLEPKPHQCYFLPAGYTIQRDLEFFDLRQHAPHGTMDFVLSSYNNNIVTQFGKPPAASIEEMVGPDDEPLPDLAYKLYMDVIFPTGDAADVPLVINAASNNERSPNGHPEQMRMHMSGFLMRGYAVAYVDHCFNPLQVVYGYGPVPFTLDSYAGLASNTAAVRFLRAHSEQFNIDANHIGAWGHSKGAYAITRLSDPNHESGSEHLDHSGGQGSPQPQPWQGYSSQISVGYQSMGFGTMRHEYVTADYAPTIIAVGEHDPYGCWEDWPDLVATYEGLDANHLALKMLGMGHTWPSGYDEELGLDRYEVCHIFFDQYLKVDDDVPPAVLYARADQTVTVHFAPVMDVQSVVENVKLIRVSDALEVGGQWTATLQNTRFIFQPDTSDYVADEVYRLVIPTAVKNEKGIFVKQQKEYEFDNTLECGDYGFFSADLNQDCVVDFRDFEKLAKNWLVNHQDN